ncbi:hypothetical protein EDB86DRAFT_2832210 [Lactarius hatsudake]|nr:hypothetical protein EDB86DRAFT_2832210 [Lactarius hatsudake]
MYIVAWWVSGVLRNVAESWRVLGRGGGRRGIARRVEAAWRVGGSGMLRAVLGWRGGGLVVRVLCAVLGRRWRGVASHIGAACWGAIGDDSHARGGGNILQRSGPARPRPRSPSCVAVVLRAMLGQRWGGVASHVGAACWGGVVVDDSRARGGGNSLQRSGRGIASHVGAACWGGDEWRWLRWLACTRGRQWPAALKPWGWSAWNNGVVAWADGKESVSHLTPACAPTSTPHPASPDSPFQAPLPSSLVVKTRQMMHWDEAQPLPPPHACKLPPFIPAPTRRPDMARNTPPPPTRRHCQPAAPP